MNAILIKIFATALALSQVTTRPDAVKTHFDPVGDRDEIVQILRDGCAHMRKAFDIEDINLDDLISTAMTDPQAAAGIKSFHGLEFTSLQAAYRQFCGNEPVDNATFDIGEIVGFYNKAVADLPDHTKLKGLKLSGLTTVLDGKGQPFAEMYEPEQRRIRVALDEIPEQVRRAFVSAEDKRFFQHHGVDERGLIRAFVGNLAQPRRPQGGSTITQQVAKNLLVGDDVTYERKIREVLVASRIEQTYTKAEILELYLNSIYLGRAAWGVELAARSYFGKSAKALTLVEGALLAGLTKGPNYFGPDRHPDRARERLAYVLNRMREDGAIGADEMKQAAAALPTLVAYQRPQRDDGFYFVDHLGHEAKALAGIDSLTGGSYTVRSTLIPELQRTAEAALQEGLARYELNTGRVRFAGAETNLADAVRRIDTENAKSNPGDGAKPQRPAWQQALEAARLPLYDVHWPAAIVLDKGRGKNTGAIRVGLSDGRILALAGAGAGVRRALNAYDVVYVRVTEGKGREARAELRVRPTVQGAAVVLENKTGRILAMAGGFSYRLSQLNRTTQARRQPGSALKPITYLAALRSGLQPNTLVLDTPVTLPPIGNPDYARERDYWTPKNYDGGSSGVLTLRRALENSKNLVTARLLDGGIDAAPEESLDRVCEIAMEAQLYSQCVRYYPFVLGAQPVRPIDMAALYAAIANEGERPAPYAIEAIARDGQPVYQHPPVSAASIGPSDHASFYQLRTMLQGVVERGTARSIRQLAPYVGGKTGTSDQENDAWFVGFTNEVTVAVWVGYDNADGKRRTLGAGETGAKVALPIFTSIVEGVWASYAPKTVLNPPSSEAKRQLVDLPIDLSTGDVLAKAGPRAFVEHFRRDAGGEVADTQYRLVSREDAFASREVDPRDGEALGGWFGGYDNGRNYQVPQWREPPRAAAPPWGGLFGGRSWWDDDTARRRTRRVDPDYPWGGRGLN
ncbi:MAG TPA: transglycosylase domain-containing protein [Xanthobacteraceae bacterium]|nr:transglycosylase domain-containing protein [Xanthobacteraceae bacterium]